MKNSVLRPVTKELSRLSSAVTAVTMKEKQFNRPNIQKNLKRPP